MNKLSHLMTEQDLECFKEAYKAYLMGSLSPNGLYLITHELLGKYGIAFEAARLLNTLERHHEGNAL